MKTKEKIRKLIENYEGRRDMMRLIIKEAEKKEDVIIHKAVETVYNIVIEELSEIINNK